MIKFSKKFRCLSLFISFAFFILLSLACASVQIEGEEKTVVRTDYPNDDVVVTVVANRRVISSFEGENSGKVESFDVTVQNNRDKSIKVVFDESSVEGQVPFLRGLQTYQQLGAVPRPITISSGFKSSFNMTSCMQWYLDSWVLNGQAGSGWFARPLALSSFMVLYIEIDGKLYKWTASSYFEKESDTPQQSTKESE